MVLFRNQTVFYLNHGLEKYRLKDLDLAKLKQQIHNSPKELAYGFIAWTDLFITQKLSYEKLW